MVWQFTDALDEVDTGYGPNLLTGDYRAQNPGWVLDGNTWAGEGSLHLHEGDPFQGPITEGDATHVVTVDVLAAAGVSVSWSVDLDTSDGPVTLGPWEDTIPAGAWVTVWQEYRTPPGTTSGSPTLTITGPAEARAPRTSRVTDQTVVRQVVAGDPDGARVVLAGDALTAYDQTGTETARIAGEGGEFVGGSFRTSDTLPGQVTLSDTASQGGPGLSIEPGDSTEYDVLPSIGPDDAGMHIRGGVSTGGDLAGALFGPEKVSIYQNGTDGSGAWIDVAGAQADLGVRPDRTDPMYESGVRAREQSVTAFSQGAAGLGDIYVSPTGASVSFKDPAEQTSAYTARIVSDASGAKLLFRPPGGTGGRFTVDAEGIWVERETTPHSQQWARYNLEETAQDSDWQPIALESGITGTSSPAWRNKNGVIYFQGFVNTTWVQGWNTIATGLDVITPVSEQRTVVPVGGAEKPLLRMTETGALQMYTPTSGGRGIQLSSLIYPLG